MLSLFQTNLLIVLGICSFLWIGFLYLIRGIKPIFHGLDNANLINATAHSRTWKWPSDMHIRVYAGTSTHQRDITVLLLVLFQKIFRDKKTEYPLFALWSFANVASAFLIYLIGAIYWGPNPALYVSLLYLSSFWMWQMSLFVAHLNVGGMLFLLGVYLLMLSIGASPFLIGALLFISGICLCCMLFASSSSPRYLLSFFAAVFFAKHLSRAHAISLHNFYQTVIQNHALIGSLILLTVIVLGLGFIKLYYKKIITAAYERKGPAFLHQLIEAKKYPLEHYIQKADEIVPKALRLLIRPIIFFFVVINLIGFNYFLPILLGFGLVFLALNLPSIKRNFGFYFRYGYGAYASPRGEFVRYVNFGYFKKKGLENISPYARGGGIGWVPKIFFTMAPFHTAIYLATLATLIIMSILSSPVLGAGSLILLIIISLLPIAWAELTQAPQVARAYSSGIMGFLILIGFGVSTFSQRYIGFWILAYIVLLVTIIWNAWKFFRYIYPARMSFNHIEQALRAFHIKELYTYDTFYNEAFFDNIKITPSLENLKINFIKSISEVQDGWIFIPPTTHKAAFFSQEKSIHEGDLTSDPVLNELLETKDIERVAKAKFRTVQGPDTTWSDESEVMSYIHLMLRDISPSDRFRGYAWLLHVPL